MKTRETSVKNDEIEEKPFEEEEIEELEFFIKKKKAQTKVLKKIFTKLNIEEDNKKNK